MTSLSEVWLEKRQKTKKVNFYHGKEKNLWREGQPFRTDYEFCSPGYLGLHLRVSWLLSFCTSRTGNHPLLFPFNFHFSLSLSQHGTFPFFLETKATSQRRDIEWCSTKVNQLLDPVAPHGLHAERPGEAVCVTFRVATLPTHTRKWSSRTRSVPLLPRLFPASYSQKKMVAVLFCFLSPWEI